MASLASTPVLDMNHDSETENNADCGPSHFKALNERDSVAAGKILVNHTISSNDAEEPRGDSKSFDRSDNDFRSSQDGDGTTIRVSQEDGSSAQEFLQYGVKSANNGKRKGSHSDENPRLRHSYHGTDSSPKLLFHGDERLDLHSQPITSNDDAALRGNRDPKSPPISKHMNTEGSENPRVSSTSASWQGHEYEHEPQSVSQVQRAQQVDVSDAQLVDALQHDAYSHDAFRKSRGSLSRPLESSAQEDQPFAVPSFIRERSHSTAQVSRKRKRVFSNRTKTGCMTCRRRKKKCDEQHPACEL